MHSIENQHREGIDGRIDYSGFGKPLSDDTIDKYGIDWKIFDSKTGVRIRDIETLKTPEELNAIGASQLTGPKLEHVREHGEDIFQDEGIIAALPLLANADNMLVTAETQRGLVELHELKATDKVRKIYIKEEVDPKEELVVRGIIENKDNFNDPVITAVNEILQSGQFPTNRGAVSWYLDKRSSHPPTFIHSRGDIIHRV